MPGEFQRPGLIEAGYSNPLDSEPQVPLNYRIDVGRRLIVAWAEGPITARCLFDYQTTVWSRPEVAGFLELLDMTQAGTVVAPTPAEMRELANLAARMSATVPTGRTAVVAPQQLVFGLGRMYEAYRGLQAGEAKEFAVFRTLGEASTFLGVDLSGAAADSAAPT